MHVIHTFYEGSLAGATLCVRINSCSLSALDTRKKTIIYSALWNKAMAERELLITSPGRVEHAAGAGAPLAGTPSTLIAPT